MKLLNYFPVKGGVFDQFSPKAILTGELVHYKYYLMPFGTYCQIHVEDALLIAGQFGHRVPFLLGLVVMLRVGTNF